MRISGFMGIAAALVLTACAPGTSAEAPVPEAPVQEAPVQEAPLQPDPQLLDDQRILSADDMEGREVGSEGNARARAYIVARFEQIGLSAIDGQFEQMFDYARRDAPDLLRPGINLVARIEGSGDSDLVLVVTAHYDHLGLHDGQIFNGSDDNASGVAALLAAATDFIACPPLHDVIFVAFDAEEGGHGGSQYFVDNPPLPLGRIALNINLDMVSVSTERRLWVAGTYHYSFLRPLVERFAADAIIDLPMGHDQPSDGDGDWTDQSDHRAFHVAGIPFIYFGVEDHPNYHQPTDTFENSTPVFFQDASMTITAFARLADAELDAIAAASGR